MNQITNILNAVLPYVVLIAVGIVAIYSYAKQHNPAFADKMKWLYDAAQYIVNQQATRDNANGAEKKATATAALLEQAKQSKTRITPETARGMIETAYQQSQKDDATTGIDNIQGFANDEDKCIPDDSNTVTDGTDTNVDTAK